MKKQFVSFFILFASITAFSQVEISVPYENGQVTVVVNITYPKTILSADSVLVEASYQSYSDAQNPKTYIKEKTVKGLAKSITLANSFESKENLRTYRCTVYQKGKAAVVSNEVQIDYNRFKYNTSPLPKIANLKAITFENEGVKYATLTWDEVPNAFGYIIGERDWNGAEEYLKFQLGYGGPMSESITNSFTFAIDGNSGMVREYGVIAVNTPYADFSKTPFANILSVKVTVP